MAVGLQAGWIEATICDRAVPASHTAPVTTPALFHLLAAETSCYRSWGQRIWTDYGAELSRRTAGIITRSET